MRNEARPIGEQARDKSPTDDRESVTPDRQSNITDRGAEERRVNGDAEDNDPTMPADDSTLNTKI